MHWATSVESLVRIYLLLYRIQNLLTVLYIILLDPDMQNICNLIGPEEYNVNRIVLSMPNLVQFGEKKSRFPWCEKIELKQINS